MCFPVAVAKFLRTAFYRTPLLVASDDTVLTQFVRKQIYLES